MTIEGWERRLEELGQARKWAALVEGLADEDRPVQPASAPLSDEQGWTGVRGSGRYGATEGDS